MIDFQSRESALDSLIPQALMALDNKDLPKTAALLEDIKSILLDNEGNSQKNDVTTPPSSNTNIRSYVQLQAAYNILRANRDKTQWIHCFGIVEKKSPPSTSLVSIQRRSITQNYKKLAALVHPDKFKASKSSDTLFQYLQEGYEYVLSLINDDDAPWTAKKESKKRKQYNDDASEDNTPDDTEFAWWSIWEKTMNEEQNDDENNSTAIDDGDDDIQELKLKSIDELRSIVMSRQDMLLTRSVHSLSMNEKKAALARARRVLNEKLSRRKESACDDTLNGNGFLVS